MTIDSNELFELCKKVYKATGWYGSGSAWRDGTPIYSSDYLLDKLPYKIGKANYAIWLRLGKTRNSYTVCYMGSDLVCIYDFEADTPLKALLRLTLKLHEDKIL